LRIILNHLDVFSLFRYASQRKNIQVKDFLSERKEQEKKDFKKKK